MTTSAKKTVENLYHISENGGDHYFIIEGLENAKKFAKDWRDGGAFPTFVKTVQVASNGILWPDDFVAGYDNDYPCLQNRIKKAEALESVR